MRASWRAGQGSRETHSFGTKYKLLMTPLGLYKLIWKRERGAARASRKHTNEAARAVCQSRLPSDNLQGGEALSNRTQTVEAHEAHLSRELETCTSGAPHSSCIAWPMLCMLPARLIWTLPFLDAPHRPRCCRTGCCVCGPRHGCCSEAFHCLVITWRVSPSLTYPSTVIRAQ